MSVETDVLSMLPQNGVALIDATKLATWKTIATTELQKIDNRIGGSDLDALLTAKMVVLGLTFLDRDPSVAEQNYKTLLNAVLSYLPKTSDKVSRNYEVLSKKAALPDYWSK